MLQILIRLMSNNSVSLLSFQASSFLIPWFLILWLSHNAEIEKVGEFGFILALISPICMFLASPSRNYLLSDYTDDLFRKTLDLRRIFVVLGLVIACFIGIALNEIWFVVAIYLAKITEMLFDLAISVALKNNNNKALFRLSLSKWLSVFGAFSFTFFIKDISFILIVLSVFFIIVSLGRTAFCRMSLVGLLALFKHSLPLSASAVVFSVYFNIPRYVLGQAEQEALLAVFSISSFLLLGGLVLVNSIMQSKLPKLSASAKEPNPRAFYRLAIVTFGFVLIVFASLQIARVEIFSEMFWNAHNNLNKTDPDFNNVYNNVLIMTLGPLLFSFSNYFLVAIQKYKLLLMITLVNTLVLYSISTRIFETYGIDGLLLSINCSGFFQFIVITVICYTHKVHR